MEAGESSKLGSSDKARRRADDEELKEEEKEKTAMAQVGGWE